MSELKGATRVNVQVDAETNEMLKILKKRIRAKSMGEIIKGMIEEKYDDVADLAKKRAAELEAATRGEGDE